MEPLALSHVLLISLVFSAMLVGLVGLIIPVYPGLNIIWIAALIYAIVDGFTWPAWLYFAFITLLMLVGNLADNYFINIQGAQNRRKLAGHRRRIHCWYSGHLHHPAAWRIAFLHPWRSDR